MALMMAVLAGSPINQARWVIYPSETLYPAEDLYPTAG
jgi:hypothetical protein